MSEIEYLIEMKGERRSDGSVIFKSPDLPMFSAVGKNEAEAMASAIEILRDYLAANVPDFVQLRVVPPATGIISWATAGETTSSVLPAHVIATMRGRIHATSGSADS